MSDEIQSDQLAEQEPLPALDAIVSDAASNISNDPCIIPAKQTLFDLPPEITRKNGTVRLGLLDKVLEEVEARLDTARPNYSAVPNDNSPITREEYVQAIAAFKPYLAGLSQAEQLLSAHRKGYVKQAGKRIPVQRLWPKGRRVVPHHEKIQSLRERIYEAIAPLQERYKRAEVQTREQVDVVTTEIIDARTLGRKAKKSYDGLGTVYHILAAGLTIIKENRYDEAAKILGYDPKTDRADLTSILKTLALRESRAFAAARGVRKKCEDIEGTITRLAQKLGSSATSLQRDVKDVRDLIENYSYVLDGMEPLFPNGATLKTQEREELIIALRAEIELDGLLKEVVAYRIVLQLAKQNVNTLKFRGDRGRYGFNLTSEFQEIEPRVFEIAARSQHYSQQVTDYYLGIVASTESAQTELKAAYSAAVAILARRAQALTDPKIRIATLAQLDETKRELTDVLETINAARMYTFARIIPDLVVSDEDYRALTQFSGLVGTVKLRLDEFAHYHRERRAAPISEFYSEMKDADYYVRLFGVTDPSAQTYMREARRLLDSMVLDVKGLDDPRIKPVVDEFVRNLPQPSDASTRKLEGYEAQIKAAAQRDSGSRRGTGSLFSHGAPSPDEDKSQEDGWW